MDSITTRPRPVLMMPLRRCGSHALRLRLNNNSDFYAPYPLHIVDFMPLVELYGDLTNDTNYFQMITDVIGLQSGLMVKWPSIVFDPVDIFNKIKDEQRSVHRIVYELLFEIGKSQGANVVMDKSLDSVFYAEELLELFPDMLFLNVIRDPRAQVSSMNKAIIHDFDTVLNTMSWVESYEKSINLTSKYPDKVLTIRYEDFVSNEDYTLNLICDFFGIPYSNKMSNIKTSDEASSIATRSSLWVSNSSSPIAANVDKFKKTLTMEEIEIIETLAGEMMDKFGYERMTKASAKINNERIVEARNKSITKKNNAWQDLRINDPKDYMLRKYRSDYIDMVKSRLERDKDFLLKIA